MASFASYYPQPLTPPTMPYDTVAVHDLDSAYDESLGLGMMPHAGPSSYTPFSHTQSYATSPGIGYKGFPPAVVDTSAFAFSDSDGGAAMTMRPPKRVDMNMAPNGSTAAAAGIHTPLAQYTAQMVVWLWYGDHRTSAAFQTPAGSPDIKVDSPPLGTNPFDTSFNPHYPLNQHQVSPVPAFTEFVSRLLRITMVSHSVTLIALLYIYRLKMQNTIEAGPGTETRPFIASLILSNKYLDDNTYTNKTWAELTNLPVSEINRMEAEFLKGLQYSLAVDTSDYKAWRDMLDGFILARQREQKRYVPTLDIPSGPYHVPHSAYIPSEAQMSMPPRARSESPPTYLEPPYHNPAYVQTHSRKRSAENAFACDIATPAGLYEALRIPVRKVQLNIPPSSFPPDLGSRSSYNTPVQSQMPSGLARSTSLNRKRQIARMPTTSRRGSAGHVYGSHEEDLLHAATQHQMQLNGYGGLEYVPVQGYNSLVMPYEEGQQPDAIPPEHLLFYTLAATPHPGQDGAPRKAILRHQIPHPYSYPPHHPAYQQAALGLGSAYDDLQADQYPDLSTPMYGPVPGQGQGQQGLGNGHGAVPGLERNPYKTSTSTSPQHPHSQSQSHPYSHLHPYAADPEPGQFANNGPAGYLYDPNMPPFNYNDPSYDGLHSHFAPPQAHLAATGHPQAQHMANMQLRAARSEWSSPMPSSHDWRM